MGLKPREKPSLARLAIGGQFEALVDQIAAANDDAYERDAVIYQWLCVAEDHGHDDGPVGSEDMLETSSLRYDDGQLVTGHLHFELGCWYLLAEHGLPFDLEKGKAHLDFAQELKIRESVTIESEIKRARTAMTSKARAVFDPLFP